MGPQGYQSFISKFAGAVESEDGQARGSTAQLLPEQTREGGGAASW